MSKFGFLLYCHKGTFIVHGRAGQDCDGNHSQGGVEEPIGGRIKSAVFTERAVTRYIFYGAFMPVVPEDGQRILHSLRWQRKYKCFWR